MTEEFLRSTRNELTPEEAKLVLKAIEDIEREESDREPHANDEKAA